MVLGTSIMTLGLSAGSIFLFGHQVAADMIDALAMTGAISAFVAICSAEAALAS
jgi:hypothetical protein